MTDAVPDSDKVLSVEAFVGCSDVDTVFFDKPYYLAPGEGGEEAFAVIREGMRARGVAAVAHAVLFRRVRSELEEAGAATYPTGPWYAGMEPFPG